MHAPVADQENGLFGGVFRQLPDFIPDHDRDIRVVVDGIAVVNVGSYSKPLKIGLFFRLILGPKRIGYLIDVGAARRDE